MDDPIGRPTGCGEVDELAVELPDNTYHDILIVSLINTIEDM